MVFTGKRKLPPESLLYTGNVKHPTKIRHFQYSEKDIQHYDHIKPLKDDKVDFFIVEGLQDVSIINDVCLGFGVDTLVIEDILNVHQRNKVEVFEEYIFLVQEYCYLSNGVVVYDYISVLMFEDKLLTFSEKNNQILNDIVLRLNDENSIIRHQKHRYLFYVITDMIVDEKYSAFYYLESKINDLENKLLELDSGDEVQLYNIRKELLFLRNSSTQFLENAFGNLEIINRLQDNDNKKYYADLKDHLVSLESKTKFEIDIINNLYDMHLNNLSRRMNSIMTTLTIFSAIFIPLSLFASIFGMNFTNFKILNNQYGLLYFIIICIITPLAMLLFFKKKKWF